MHLIVSFDPVNDNDGSRIDKTVDELHELALVELLLLKEKFLLLSKGVLNLRIDVMSQSNMAETIHCPMAIISHDQTLLE